MQVMFYGPAGDLARTTEQCWRAIDVQSRVCTSHALWLFVEAANERASASATVKAVCALANLRLGCT